MYVYIQNITNINEFCYFRSNVERLSSDYLWFEYFRKYIFKNNIAMAHNTPTSVIIHDYYEDVLYMYSVFCTVVFFFTSTGKKKFTFFLLYFLGNF